MNDRNTAYVASALRDHDFPARSGPFLAATASRSWLRRSTVAAALAIGDVLVVLTVLRLSGLVLGEHSQHLVDNVLGASPILIGIYWASGIYTGLGPSPFERLRLRTLGALAFCAIGTIWAVHTATVFAGYVWFAAEVLLLLVVIGHYVEVLVLGLLKRQGIFGAPTVIVGTSPAAHALFRSLASEPTLGFRPVGFLHLPANPTDDTRYRSPADHLALSESAEVALVTSDQELCVLEKHFGVPTGFERVLMAVDGEHLQSLYLPTRTLGAGIGIEISNAARLHFYRWVKRLLDLLISIPAAIVTLPLVAVLALAIKFIFRESAFFTQDRVGWEGRIFRVFKIRTMYDDGERRLADHFECHPEARAEWERFIKLSNDPRILPMLGTAIRRWSLDELPQLWNVIRGDMSLVGPRPFPEYHTARFDEHFRLLRASVLPGITGLWQVSSRSDGDLSVQRAQDLFYIRNQSLWLDLYIILQTIPAILSAKGAK
jgi:lipopolysaccharide/colanic/teichoic acid biosynthesis glycosyltransferase